MYSEGKLKREGKERKSNKEIIQQLRGLKACNKTLQKREVKGNTQKICISTESLNLCGPLFHPL